LHDPAQAFVRADRLRLRQVLLNLVSNAIKYNRRGGHVEVTVEPDGEQLAIVVADTGIGLSAQQQAQLFRPFSRVGAETTEVPGTGLGLSIARRLTELMGGTLEAASRPGEGSRFTLRLPAAAAPPGTPGQRGAPTLQADGGRAGPEVFELLLVEDNPVNAEVVIATVRQRPAWRLRHARSGAQAVALAQQRRPHLTLVDMHLGDMTGLDLMAAMDRHPATAGLPRVALSADALSEHIDAAVGAGFERYLVKPLDLQALLRCLDEWERRLATAAQAGANPA
jgi:CheY-like chemotaxis protein/anti-sigma regulatory factor (Ser/Thr protein kinase)